ncbi:MAG: alpha-ketoacid dehydrogenase subunit alpha/beta [Chlamydiales bacterium]
MEVQTSLSQISIALLENRTLCLQILHQLYITRSIDQKMQKLAKQNKGGTFHLCTDGHELVGIIAAFSLISKTDWAFPYYRDRAFVIGIGAKLVDLFASFLGKQSVNHSSSKQMPEHFSDTELRIPCQSSVVGSQFLQAVGTAKAISLQKKREVVYVSGGDGSTSQGDFHEALNFSCLHKLPIIFVIQDNGWAISVPVSEQTTGGTCAKMASGYEGLAVVEVDGCAPEPLAIAMQNAVTRARDSLGPSLIVAKISRIGGHSSSDDPKKYKTKTDIEKDIERDPIPKFEQWLLEREWVDESDIQVMRRSSFTIIEEAASQAVELPSPDVANFAKETNFQDSSLIKTDSSDYINPERESIVIVDALNHALEEEMRRDSSIIVFGQDVAGGKGGVFGVTKDLTRKFGQDRCFNTPLAESTIIGLALGMSLAGMTPVGEIQFADYIWTGVNQLFNELASIHFRSNGEWNCPVVIRIPYGGYIQGGPYHSQSIEAFLIHHGGLKVVVPSNATDAKCLLKAAIRDPNPVIFLEHKALYRQRLFCARLEPSNEQVTLLGKGLILTPGSDVTVVCYGMIAVMAYEIAQKLQEENISVEVVDLRTLFPYDLDLILRSVQKTGKLLIAHEAAKVCGFGAEIAAAVMETSFSSLDAPIMRIGGLHVPVPYSKELENVCLPQKFQLETAIRELSMY